MSDSQETWTDRHFQYDKNKIIYFYSVSSHINDICNATGRTGEVVSIFNTHALKTWSAVASIDKPALCQHRCHIWMYFLWNECDVIRPNKWLHKLTPSGRLFCLFLGGLVQDDSSEGDYVFLRICCGLISVQFLHPSTLFSRSVIKKKKKKARDTQR